MLRATRIAVVAILAMAIAALPVVLDRCAESCEAHQIAIASTPACHHAASAGAHISQVPTPCGHDHNGTAVTAADNTAPAGRTLNFIALVGTLPPLALPAQADLRARPHSPPSSSATLDRRSLPLRV